MVPTRKIKPYHRNVRKNNETVKKLVELIPKIGFNVPLVLDRNNVIVKGHTRWKAAIQLGLDQVPCVYTDADEETIKLDRLTDNRIQEFSLWDDSALREEVSSLKLAFEFDLGSLNFNVAEPQEPPPPPPPPPARAQAERTPEDVVPCPNCGSDIIIYGE